jgi:hypothetical protein
MHKTSQRFRARPADKTAHLAHMSHADKAIIARAARFVPGRSLTKFMRQAADRALGQRLRQIDKTSNETHVFVHMTREAKAVYACKAKQLGISLSEYLRSAALALAAEEAPDAEHDAA